MFGVSPREMQKAMKRMGIRQEEIYAKEVIIRTYDKDLVIRNPHVSKVNMMGQETFQVSGDIVEVGVADEGKKADINEEDMSAVMEQTNCSKEEASEALEESNGNLAEAILKLQSKRLDK